MANPLYFPVFRAFDNNGDPLAGGKVYTYEAGTSTPKASYTDSTMSVQNANPVILDAYGSAPIWIDGDYKINLTDANDVQQNDFPVDHFTNDSGEAGPAGTFPIATAGGTVDAITADYSPNVTLSNLTTVGFVATGANTITNPTFAPDGLTARTITKKGGVALVPGDIPGALSVCILEYNSANTRWELLNPASTNIPWVVATGTADALTATYSPAIPALYDGLILSFRAAAANATTTPTFAPSGLTARTITKKGGTALAVGDIGGNLAEYFVRYNLANTRWELLNPTGVSGIVDLTTATPAASADYFAFHDATDGALKKALISSITGGARNQFTPANPTGTTSASQVMMGMGSTASFTPTGSGNVLVTYEADIAGTSGGVTLGTRLRYGTGAAPSNGGAAAGTTVGRASAITVSNGGYATPHSLTAYITGLTPSTAYWFDISLGTSGGTATVANNLFIVTEY